MIFIKAGDLYGKIFDQGWLEYYGGQQLKCRIINLSIKFQLFSNNHLKIYFILRLIWIIFLILNIFYLNSLYRA